MALRSRGLSAAAAVVVLAGCGGGGQRAVAPAASRGAPTPTPDPLYDKANGCGIPTSLPFATPKDLVPFLAPPYVTTITAPSGAGYRVVVFVDRPLGLVLDRIRSGAAAKGIEVLFSEREPFEAEITLRDPDGEVYAFKLLILAQCPESVQMTVVRLQQ